MAKKMNIGEMMEVLMGRLDAMDARIDAMANTTEKAGKADKKAGKAEVVDTVTYRTQEFHKELKTVGMVSGKDYWVHTNEKGKTKLFACVHHTQPDWARKLEALGFTATRAYGGSTPAFAIYCRTTGDLKVDLFKSDKQVRQPHLFGGAVFFCLCLASAK